MADFSAATAAGLVGIISIANGSGRFLWAWLSDFIGCKAVFLTMFLVQAAASGWNVAPGDLRTESGEVIHDATGRRIGYGALTGRAAGLKPPADPPIKDPKDFRLIGKPLKRLDTP